MMLSRVVKPLARWWASDNIFCTLAVQWRKQEYTGGVAIMFHELQSQRNSYIGFCPLGFMPVESERHPSF